MTPDLIPNQEPPSATISIEMCATHKVEMATALTMRGMGKYVLLNDDDRRLLAELGQSDPLTCANVQLAMSAMSTFGPQLLKSAGACPVCAFHSIVSVIADAMATQFTKGN
jgi:hypothetical protein